MKGIQQYRADRRRQQRINKVVTPIVDTASIITQVNGTMFGAMGTTKLRQSTMGVSRMFESRKQQKDADQLEQVVLIATLAVAAGKGAAKGVNKVKARMAERAYAKAAEKQAEVKVEATFTAQGPTTPPTKPVKRTYTKRASAGSKV